MHIFKSNFSTEKKFINFRPKIKFVVSSSQACKSGTTLAAAKISCQYTTYSCYSCKYVKMLKKKDEIMRLNLFPLPFPFHVLTRKRKFTGFLPIRVRTTS